MSQRSIAYINSLNPQNEPTGGLFLLYSGGNQGSERSRSLPEATQPSRGGAPSRGGD